MRQKVLDTQQVLQMINNHNSIQEIADAMCASKATIHKMLRILEADGLVKPSSKERAARSRQLTEAGKRFLNDPFGYRK